MRHFGQVGIGVFAADVFAQADGQRGFGILEVIAFKKIAQVDNLAGGVRQLNTDGVGAGNNRNTHRNGAHGAGNIIRQADNSGSFGAGCRFKLIKGDDRAGADADNLAGNAEFLQNLFQPGGNFFKLFLA